MTVAIDGVLDDVKTDKRDEARSNHGDHHANPRRSVDTAIVAEANVNLSGDGGVAEDDGKQKREEKAVATCSLQEISACDGKDGAASFHVATPFFVLRCLESAAR